MDNLEIFDRQLTDLLSTHLGGQDFDTNLLEHFKKEFTRKTKKGESPHPFLHPPYSQIGGGHRGKFLDLGNRLLTLDTSTSARLSRRCAGVCTLSASSDWLDAVPPACMY